MTTINKALWKTRRFTRGQTMTEYAMILATIAIVVLSAYQLLGTRLNTMLGSVDTLL